MNDEIQRDPGSPVANYWLAVAARGAGDIDGAWNYADRRVGPLPALAGNDGETAR